MEKELGKIIAVSFGKGREKPFLFGLELVFRGKGWSVFSMINANISNNYKGDDKERNAAFFEVCKKINKLLEDANVNSVDELIGKHVEVTFEHQKVIDYRILTEVI